MPMPPVLSCCRGQAVFLVVTAGTRAAHLSTDLSRDWQLPDSDPSGLMKASSI